MPTLTTPTLDRLAALIAVERQAADESRRSAAIAEIKQGVWGSSSVEYRQFAEIADGRIRELLNARTAVDEALFALSTSARRAAA